MIIMAERGKLNYYICTLVLQYSVQYDYIVVDVSSKACLYSQIKLDMRHNTIKQHCATLWRVTISALLAYLLTMQYKM